MKIIKNWFYKLSEFKTKELIIEENIVVSIFDDVNKNIDIEIWENSRVEFYSVLENKKDYKINFIQNKTNSDLRVNYLLLSKNNKNIKAKINSEINASHTTSNVKIISIIWNEWFVDLDWIIKIKKWVEKVDWNLEEENLFLWDTWKVKAIPTLLVRSNDVKASHSCKMERISDEKLFYLRSRWIWRENALSMIIEARIKSLFSNLSMIDNEFYEKLINNIIKKWI